MHPPPQVEPYSKCWTTAFDNKKAIYGKMRVAVSGNDGEPDNDESAADDDVGVGDAPPVVVKNGVVRSPNDRGGSNIEPVTFNSLPVGVWRDQMKAYRCSACYDMTPLDGNLLLVCVELKIAYVGVCFNDHHVSELRGWVIKQILKRTSPTLADGAIDDRISHHSSSHGRSSIAHPPTHALSHPHT